MSKILIDEATVKLALEVLETEHESSTYCDEKDCVPEYIYDAITALREALAEQPAPAAQQEPVAWMQDSIELYVQDRPGASYTIPLYTTPQAQPAREPLTWEQRVKIVSNAQRNELDEYDLIGAIEAAHGITKGNT